MTSRGYSAERGLKALQLFVMGAHSAPEIADRTGIGEVTARGVVRQLVNHGFVEEHPDLPRRYRLATGGFALGLALVESAMRELESREDDHRHPLAGRALFHYRRTHGLSQERFARVLGTDAFDYGLIERGEREIAGQEVVEFAARLDVDLLDLLMMNRGGEGMGYSGPARDVRSDR
jgi:hypothetical protein